MVKNNEKEKNIPEGSRHDGLEPSCHPCSANDDVDVAASAFVLVVV